MDEHEIKTIRDQFQAQQWPKWLNGVAITGLRGWTGQTVTFRFPITAIVGENGTGKTTVLRVAACGYEAPPKTTTEFFPSSLFVETQWDQIAGVRLQYTARQGETTDSFAINKPTERWSYPDKRPVRDVFFFDIGRILPLDATVGYAKVAKQRAEEISTSDLSAEFRDPLSHILGRTYTKARFVQTKAAQGKPVGLLAREIGEISQFHQGAGEDATFDLLRSLESIPNTSLVIIDEVEASLHPRAQRRLIRFLTHLCRIKRLQVIVSTHSPYVLEELPPEARVLLLPGPTGTNVVYGASPEFALSRIDEDVHPELHVFVEDREGAVLVREILAADAAGGELLPRIAIHPVGPANVVQMLGDLGHANKLPYKAVGVVDGDANVTPACLRLPGTVAPERLVFDGLKAKGWPNLPERFSVGAGDLLTVLDDAMLEPDHHQWARVVGDRIIKSRTGVWEILANEWVKQCLAPAERTALVEAIKARLS